MKKILCAIMTSLMCLASGVGAFALDEGAGSDTLLLLNKTHSVAPEYAPEGMVDIAQLVPAYKATVLLREDAANAFVSLRAAMDADGINNMKALSGYRDFQYQTGLFNRQAARWQKRGADWESASEKASWSVAIPGTSEHQAGLAIDVSVDGSTSLSFRNTEAGLWMKENSHKFGFVLRYAEEKTAITGINFEPWHFRYVGLPHATYMAENNLCFEEYIELLQNEKHIAAPGENGSRFDVYYTTDPDEEYDGVIDVSGDNCGGAIVTTLTPAVDIYLKEKNILLTNRRFYDTLCEFGGNELFTARRG